MNWLLISKFTLPVISGLTTPGAWFPRVNVSALSKFRFISGSNINRPELAFEYDKWCIDGPLSIVISRRDIYDARLDDNAKLILAVTVYFIWQERNFRMFKGESRSEDVLSKAIYDGVKSKLLTVRVKKSFRADFIAIK
ncbi:hypothetical protein Tco_1033860 [Tanacetum coccineum]